MRTAAALAALLASLVAGCARPGEEPSAEQGIVTLRVLGRRHLSMAPLVLAEAEGYFRDQGLAIDWLPVGSGHEGIVALLRGDLDVLTSMVDLSYFNAIAQGARLRLVADRGYLDRDGCTYLGFVTRTELLHDGELQRPADRPLRYSLERTALAATLAMRALAGSPAARDAQPFHLSGESERLALLQGRVDLTSNSGASLQKILASGKAALYRRGQDLFPDGQFAITLFGPRLLDREPQLGIRFLAAYLRGVRQYQAGKTERNVALLAEHTRLEPAEVRALCWLAMRADGRVNVASLEELQDSATALGLMTRRLEPAEYWEPRFVEAAAAKLEGRPADEGGNR